MTNYKPLANNSITSGGVTIPVNGNHTIVQLYLNYNLLTAPRSFDNIISGIDYEVESGTTYHLIGLKFHCAANGIMTIHSGVTDAAQSTLKWTSATQPTFATDQDIYLGNLNLTFTSAEPFIVFDTNNAMIEWVTAIGYET